MMGGRQCGKPGIDYNTKVFGYKPIYSNDASLKQVVADTAHPVKKAGKIYAYQNYLLQCEEGEGIHVIDNSNPAMAKRTSFIKVLGCNEISIKDNFLYTNSYRDLVTINISNINQPVETQRIANAFNAGSGYLPEPPEKGYYECVSLSKGMVVGWIKDSILFGCYKN
jgi:hypothetical protein